MSFVALSIAEFSVLFFALWQIYRAYKQRIKFLAEFTDSSLALYLPDDQSLLPYLTASYFIFAASINCLVLYKQFFHPIETKANKQYVEIELVSAADYQNKKNVLPSTTPKPSLGKRFSPIDVSDTSIPLTSSLIKLTKREQEKSIRAVQGEKTNSLQKHDTYVVNSIVRLPAKPKVNNATKIAQSEQNSSQLDLEEMQPLALTEIKDNDGDDSIELWQDGGHSNQGLGASSELTDYLKELHKKLKQAWRPPETLAHHIKVLFRLAGDGSIMSLKLTASCGDPAADNSALIAIRKSAPFGNLPKECVAGCLDLAYTFNYSADEMRELSSESQTE